MWLGMGIYDIEEDLKRRISWGVRGIVEHAEFLEHLRAGNSALTHLDLQTCLSIYKVCIEQATLVDFYNSHFDNPSVKEYQDRVERSLTGIENALIDLIKPKGL